VRRQVPAGRPVGPERPELKIMNMIPADGSTVALSKIRKIATGKDYHMSASTLTKALKELTQAGKLKRTVDALGGRPHYVYSRTLVPPAGRVAFDDWFEPRLLMLKLMMMHGMSMVLTHPQKDLDQVIHSTMFGFLEPAARIDLADFQKLVRSGRMAKTETLLDEQQIMRQWAEAFKLGKTILSTSP
jgi:hypothetical protein